jgi:hypothetical protein
VSWDALISVATMLAGLVPAEQGAAGAYVIGGVTRTMRATQLQHEKRIYAVQCKVMPGRGLIGEEPYLHRREQQQSGRCKKGREQCIVKPGEGLPSLNGF